MKLTRYIIVLAAIFLILAPALFAQSTDPAMTDKELTRFIADWPAVYKWFEDRSQKISTQADGSIPAALFLNKDFSAFIAKRGWTDARFSYVTGSAFSLMTIVAVEKKNPEIAQQFDDAIAQIEASELPAAEKAENIKNMNEAKKATLAISGGKDINQAELKLVRAHYDELMALVQKMQKK